MTEIRVLLVEDELAELHQMLLEAHNGIDFVCVNRGDYAVLKARSEQFDAIIMDLRLPELGGIQAIYRIREFDPDIPIIAFTAWGDKGNRRAAEIAGASAFVTKPPNYAKLRQKVIELVTRRRAKPDRATQDELAMLNRRLNILREQAAAFGMNVAPEIMIEIQDIETKISSLKNINSN